MPFYENIHYKVIGADSSPAVLFLHGFLGSSQSWNEVIEYIGKDFLCITPDLPGHGKSFPEDDLQYAMPECAETVIKLLEKSRIGKCHLVGYSMGGRLALFIALKYPDRIEKLVLESSTPGLKTVDEREQRAAADEKLAARLKTVPLEEFLRDWYDQPLFNSIKSDKNRYNILLQKRLNNDSIGMAKSLRFMGTGVQESLWEDLPNLNCQTLLIAGDYDTKFQQIAGEMATLSDRITLSIMKGTGHNVHFEQPEQYAQNLKSFFS